jgi:hypothetical protein
MGFLDNLATGYQRGQAKFAANEAARAEFAEKQAKAAREAAEFRLKLEQHSQALMNSAETEYNAIITEIGGEHWDPSKLPTILPRIKNFDQTYGRIWNGGRLSDEVQKMLHMDGESAPALPDGAQGPPAPGGGRSPLWGYASPEQFDAARDRRMATITREVAPQLQQDAMNYLNAHARGADGLLDPQAAPAALMSWRARAMRESGVDPEVFMKVMDDLSDQLGKVLEAQTKDLVSPEEMNKTRAQMSERGSRWVNSLFASQFDSMGNITGFMEGSQPIRNAMDTAYQRYINMGYEEPTIKILLAQDPRLMDAKTGRWRLATTYDAGIGEWVAPGTQLSGQPEGVTANADPLLAGYASAPPEFTAYANQMFASGQAVDGRDIPVYDKQTGESGILTPTADGRFAWVGGAPFTPARVVEAPPQEPEAEKPKKKEREKGTRTPEQVRADEQARKNWEQMKDAARAAGKVIALPRHLFPSEDPFAKRSGQ